jgi:hypothetical protein
MKLNNVLFSFISIEFKYSKNIYSIFDSNTLYRIGINSSMYIVRRYNEDCM